MKSLQWTLPPPNEKNVNLLRYQHFGVAYLFLNVGHYLTRLLISGILVVIKEWFYFVFKCLLYFTYITVQTRIYTTKIQNYLEEPAAVYNLATSLSLCFYQLSKSITLWNAKLSLHFARGSFFTLLLFLRVNNAIVVKYITKCFLIVSNLRWYKIA